MNQNLLRSRASVFAAPVLVLTVFYLNQQISDAPYYGLAQVAHAASAIAIIGPLCAGLAAWEGWRVRSGRIHQLAPARLDLAIALRSLLPVWILALAAFGVALAFTFSDGPRLPPGDLLVLVIPGAVTLAHTSLGYAVGRLLPAVFAIPAVVVASWLWLVYPIALHPLWIRHLTGYMNGCCDTSTVLAPGAFAAPLVISAAAVVAALASSVQSIRPPVRLAAALGVLAAGAALAASLVSHLDNRPTAPRPVSELTCRGTDPEVCVWPEHRSVAPLIHERASKIRNGLRRLGIDSPATVREGDARAPGPWLIGVVPGARADAVDTTLVEGLLPQFPPCAEGRTPYPGIRAYWPMALWVARVSDSSTAILRYNLRREDYSVVRAVLGGSDREQADWYRANREALSACRVQPRLTALR